MHTLTRASNTTKRASNTLKTQSNKTKTQSNQTEVALEEDDDDGLQYEEVPTEYDGTTIRICHACVLKCVLLFAFVVFLLFALFVLCCCAMGC